MSRNSIVLRILNIKDDEAMDWTVQPNVVTYANTMEVIRRVVQSDNVTTFEYDDVDNERITVRSDEEMMNMITDYMSTDTVEPLVIYPKVGKDADRRNIHGLKVQVAEKSSSPADAQASPMEQGQDSGSRRQASGDIRAIIANGAVNAGDLEYMCKLGAGVAGTVYKAHHTPTHTVISVKEIPLDIATEEQRKIISELEILHKCNSQFIIAFYGAFFLENRVSICTEYMDGGSLDQYKHIEEEILGRVAVSVLQGLDYLWSMKIMHRDVKPSNILVNTSGYIKLCDFGVSVRLMDSIAKTYVGTNAYMAPERIRGEDYRIQSEVWSLGLSLFELAVGQFPYTQNTPQNANNRNITPGALTKAIVDDTPPVLPKGNFSESFSHFVSTCLLKDSNQRPEPKMLLNHPFALHYTTDNHSLVARWVTSRLANR